MDAGTVGEVDAVPEITAAEAHAAQARGRLVLVDVREDREWAAGRAPGAVHLPLGRLEEGWAELGRHGKALAFVCRVGQRSHIAAALAGREGLRAFNVQGGMDAWQAAGLALEPEGGYVA